MVASLRILNLGCNGGAGAFLHRAQQSAATAIGHEWLNWAGDLLTVEHTNPDIVITDIARRIPFPTQRSYKIAMIVRQWSDDPIWPEVIQRGYDTSWDDVGYVETVQPDILYHHATPHAIKKGFHLWEDNLSRPVTSLPMAADIHYFWRPIKPFTQRRWEVAWVGSMWQYKAVRMVPYLLPVLQSDLIKSVVYGKDGWSGISEVNYRGFLPLDKEADLYHNTLIVPCCHEPHSGHGGDIVQRLYNPLASGAFVVSDYNPSICGPLEFEFSPTAIPVAQSPTEMFDIVTDIIRDPDMYFPMLIRSRQELLMAHTYEHRLADMFDALYLPTHAKHARQFASERADSLYE